MTKLWGPLGWMTLHSISINYPEAPSNEDRLILSNFMDSFAECITCDNCKNHFVGMFTSYKRRNPQWNSSRQEFFLFVCRAHNTVNKRIDKPILGSVQDCIETIKNNSKNTSLREFRKKYIDYLIQNWSREHDFRAFGMVRTARQLEKINNSYWNLRDGDIADLQIANDDVTQFIVDNGVIPSIGLGHPNIQKNQAVNIGFKIRQGKLQLGSR
jgi:FAD-linked sulfhydryl oxidase